MGDHPSTAHAIKRRPAPPARDEPLDLLAARVRWRIADRTLSRPEADLDVAQLAREVRGLSGHLRRFLVAFHGQDEGLRLNAALMSSDRDADATARAAQLLDDPVARDLAARTIAVQQLVNTARDELDELIRRTAVIEPVTTRARLIRGLLDAEEAGDTRLVSELLAEFARESRNDPGGWRKKLARARRDRIRLAQLTANDRPTRSLRQRARAHVMAWRKRLRGKPTGSA